MNLTQHEIMKIQRLGYKIRKHYEAIGERDRIIEDMAGLKIEILCNADGNSLVYPMLLIYMSLLETERFKHDPLTAYQRGKESQQLGKNFQQGLFEYLVEVEDSEASRRLAADMMKYHNWLVEALGDKRGLLRELLEEYRQVYNNVNNFIDTFFRMGYEAVDIALPANNPF